MRILIIYPGATHSTYDVARGYEKALTATEHEMGIFEYHSYIKFYQQSLRIATTDHPRLQDAVMLAATRAVIDVVDFVPDVVLVIAGGALHRRAYDLINKLRVPLVLLLTESPYLDRSQAIIMQAARVAAALTNDKWSVDRLSAATNLPVHYLPHSYDPDIHYPRPPSPPHTTTAFFHGTLWPEREVLFQGVDAHVTGHTIDGKPYNTSGTGVIKNEELAIWYSNTQIAINHHRTASEYEECPAAYSLGPRAFEIAACGAFQLCDNTRPELWDVFGDSVGTYHDKVDLQRELCYYQKQSSIREEMATAARERVKGCTFANRTENILLPVLEEAYHGRWTT